MIAMPYTLIMSAHNAYGHKNKCTNLEGKLCVWLSCDDLCAKKAFEDLEHKDTVYHHLNVGRLLFCTALA